MKKLIPILLFILCCSSSFAQLPTSGLVAWYPFCGNTNDYSGNGYNLHDSGAVLTTDRFGNANCAYAFNGTNNIMRLGYLIPVTTNFTYSCWVLPDTDQNAIIVYNGFSGSNGFGIILSDPAVYSVGHNLTILFGGINHMATYTVTTHQWHHAVLRNTSGSFDFFIDNVLVATFSGSFLTPGGTFAVGADTTGTGHVFQGNIDDISVYNRALTNTEISQLYYYNPDSISFTSGNDTTVCAGATLTLNGASGGAWSSTNPPVATVSNTGIITGISTGTSIISYTTGVGCLGTETINVTPPPAVITGPVGVCAGSAIALSDAAVGGTWSSGSSGIATVTLATGIVSGVTAGTAAITYTTGTGCFATAAVIVNPPPPPATGATSICLGSTTTLSDAITGGTWGSSNNAAATVTPGPSGGGVVTGVAQGTSVITYTLTGSCFSTETITVNPPPQVISGLTNVCTGSTAALSDPTSGGTWSSGAPGIATITPATGIVTGVTAGTADITYTTGAGCFVTASVTVYQTPSAIPGAATVCAGSTITLSDSPTGGTWSSGSSATATITPGPAGGGVVSGVAAGASAITYTSAGSCYRTTTVTVYQPPAAITGVANICTGAAITLSDLPGGGTWISGSPGIATVAPGAGVVSGVTAGAAVITYTTAGSCIATATITVNTTPAAITGPANVCTGSAITLSDSPSGGTWSSGSSGTATVTPGPIAGGFVSGIAAGTSVITYTLTGGCSSTTTVTVNPMPAAITGVMYACTGLTTTLSDTLSGGVWSSAATAIAVVGSANGIVTGVAAGMAVISYSRAGCAVTASVTVYIEPSVTAGQPNICTDGTTFVVSAPGGGAWSLSSTSVATIAPDSPDSATIYGLGLASGITIVTYSLSGCTATNTVTTVHVLPPITGPAQVCTGRSITWSNAITGGTWTSTITTIATVTASSGVVTGVAAGVPTISYTIGGSCITAATVTVNPSPYPGIINGIAHLCVGATVTLSDTVSGGIWGISNGSATVSGGLVTGASPGLDTVRYVVSTAFCTDTAAYPVTVYAVPVADSITGDTVVCVGDRITLSDPAAGGTWSSAFTAIATITTTAVVTGLSAGIDTIRYTVSNPGCATAATHIVTVYDHPAIGTVSGQAIVCDGAVITLSDAVSGGVWSSGNTAIATINNSGTIYAFGTGGATITYTIGPNAGGCISTATFTVTANAVFTTDSSVSQVKCYGDNNGSIALTVTGGSPSYSWSNGSTASSITGLIPGQYTVSIIDAATQCKASDTFYISQPDSLSVVAEATNDICKRGVGAISTTVTGGVPGYQYLWSGNGLPATQAVTGAGLQGLQAGAYTLTVTDNNNCTKTITTDIGDTCSVIIIHDVITPNGDGINDTWVIEGIDNYPANTVQVFDKWGDMVYEKSGYSNDWTGRGKSGLLPDGTYYYLIKLNTQNGTGGQNTWTGSLLIKR